jgi:hypothetical protein
MKHLIVVMILIFSCTIPAADPTNEYKIQFKDMVVAAMVQGIRGDATTQQEYIMLTLMHGTMDSKHKAAGKMAQCYILWSGLQSLDIVDLIDGIGSFEPGMERAKMGFDMMMASTKENSDDIFPKVLELIKPSFSVYLIANCSLLDRGIQLTTDAIKQAPSQEQQEPDWFDKDKQIIS